MRLTLLVEIADLNESPSQFLLQSVREVSQHIQIDYMLADAGFLSLNMLNEMPVKTIIRGKSSLKAFKELSTLPLVEKIFKVEDRIYVAYRMVEINGLYYYDVVYVKEKPRHFTFVSSW